MRAPYSVQILGGDGESLPTYAHGGRYYVEGNADERYVILISNPTPRRIEAVVTVDGLDVLDGENGDLRKRGYVVAPYGETRIEGFRTSRQDVATFRFSAVSDSYAAQKGKARNVGVIAVALFEERAYEPPPEIVHRGSRIMPGRPQFRPQALRKQVPMEAEAAPAPPPAPSADAPASASGEGAARSRRSDDTAQETRRERAGLGTEFGEQRYSAVNFTQFERATHRPVAIAELRYNDTAGLLALGIDVAPTPDDEELMLRETANPFPGERWARPPGR